MMTTNEGPENINNPDTTIEPHKPSLDSESSVNIETIHNDQVRPRGPFVQSIYRKLMERHDRHEIAYSTSPCIVDKIDFERRRPWESDCEPRYHRQERHVREDEDGKEENQREMNNQEYNIGGHTSHRIRLPSEHVKTTESVSDIPSLPDTIARTEGTKSPMFTLPFDYAMEPFEMSKRLHLNHSDIPSPEFWSSHSTMADSDDGSVYSQETTSIPPDPLPPIVRDKQSSRNQLLIARIHMALITCDIAGRTASELENRPWQDHTAVKRTYARMTRYAERALWLSTELQSDGLKARSHYWLGRAAGGQQFWHDAVRAFQDAIAFDINTDDQLSDGGLRRREKSDVKFLLHSVKQRLEKQEREEKKQRRKEEELAWRKAEQQGWDIGDFIIAKDASPWRPDVEAALRHADVARRNAKGATDSTTTTNSSGPPPSSGSIPSVAGSGSIPSTTATSANSSELNNPFHFTEEEIRYINGGSGSALPHHIGHSYYSFASPRSVPTPNLRGARHAAPNPIRIPVRRGVGKVEGKGGVKGVNRVNLEKELEGLEFGEEDFESVGGSGGEEGSWDGDGD